MVLSVTSTATAISDQGILLNELQMIPSPNEVPKFNGDMQWAGIFKAEQFYNITKRQLSISSFHMEGKALSWFKWGCTRTTLYILGKVSWKGFFDAFVTV